MFKSKYLFIKKLHLSHAQDRQQNVHEKIMCRAISSPNNFGLNCKLYHLLRFTLRSTWHFIIHIQCFHPELLPECWFVIQHRKHIIFSRIFGIFQFKSCTSTTIVSYKQQKPPSYSLAAWCLFDNSSKINVCCLIHLPFLHIFVHTVCWFSSWWE